MPRLKDRKMKIHVAYFSATRTTRTVCRGVAEFLGGEVVEYDVTNNCPENDIIIPSEDLFLVGSPVYCGRVPEQAARNISRFKGNGTKAITIVVYGNREFDDSLLELTRIAEDNGFKTFASAAFIGRHCIFPVVATERPDKLDREKMKVFADKCRALIKCETEKIELPGNDEYCPHKHVPFCPVPTEDCDNCGTCARMCPVGAISLTDASVVNTEICITCGRCVLVCPKNGRHFTGDMYDAASANFAKAYSARREPEMFFAQTK